MGRQVVLPGVPKRIISLVPSQTEFLYDIGLADRLVGQTIFCVHPSEKFKDAVKVGGTKKVRYDVIANLNPDLIICNKEENTQDIVEILSKSFPVWVSDIKNVEDACRMMEKIGQMLSVESGKNQSESGSGSESENVRRRADEIAGQVRKSFVELGQNPSHTCLYLIWKGPYMTAGRDTFIDCMLGYAGFSNLMPAGSRYPELSLEEMAALNPEFILLSSEPYPFREKHIEELSSKLPGTRVVLVDGEFFSWYGSRLLNSRNYFGELRRSLNIA